MIVHRADCPGDPPRLESFAAARPAPVVEEPVTYWQRDAARRSKHLIATTQAAPPEDQLPPTDVTVQRCIDCGAQEVIP